MRQALMDAEHLIQSVEQLELTVIHHFSHGVYAREMHIPAGTALTGKIHKTEHLCIVSAGDIEVMDQNGYKRIKAPATFVSKPGIKRLGLAHKDTVFITIHPADTQDINELEAALVCNTFKEYREYHRMNANYDLDRQDYQAYLSQQSLLNDQSENILHVDDYHVMQSVIDGIDIHQSPIDGQGLFTREAIERDTLIGQAKIGGHRTQLARFVNHSHAPNCLLWQDLSHDIWLVSLYDIDPGEELTIDYRESSVLNIGMMRLAA